MSLFTNYGPYYELAKARGLTISPPDGPGLFTTALSLGGYIEGRAVAIERRIGKHPRLFARVGLYPQLDLGLRVRPSSITTSLSSLLGTPDVEVGDAAFDDAFAIEADDPERARGLLSPSLRHALMGAKETPLVVTDGGVGVDYAAGFMGVSDDQATLEGILGMLLGVARAVDEARAGTPPSAEVAPLVERLAAFAREHGLASAFDSPPRVFGQIGGARVWIVARRRKKGVHDVEISVSFDQPLPFPFSVSTARTGFDAWLSGADIQTGDGAFDRAFDVRGQDASLILPLLDEAVRRTLSELGQGRTLELDGTGLRLSDDARDFEPVALPAMIERMADLVQSIARASRLPAQQGYR